MKKITITDYLTENCICSPDRDDFRSCCGFPCIAKWHWSLEVQRAKVEVKLGYRFNPPKNIFK